MDADHPRNGVLIARRSTVMTAGPMFSTETLTPNLDNISPIAGAKRIFSTKALKTFGMNILKVLIFGAVISLSVRDGIGPLVLSVRGGIAGALIVFDDVLSDLITTFGLLMVVFASADYAIQKSAFMAEMRMTKTEAKQESKDSNGSPQLKGHRKRLARKAAERPSGIQMANFIVFDGEGLAVAMRYIKTETTIPVIVARASGPTIRRMIDKAPQGCPIIRSPLARALSKSEPGDYVDVELIRELGPLMVSAKLL